jgi:hypothetical protein
MARRLATTARRTPRQERARFTVTALLDATARVLVQCEIVVGYLTHREGRAAQPSGKD